MIQRMSVLPANLEGFGKQPALLAPADAQEGDLERDRLLAVQSQKLVAPVTFEDLRQVVSGNGGTASASEVARALNPKDPRAYMSLFQLPQAGVKVPALDVVFHLEGKRLMADVRG